MHPTSHPRRLPPPSAMTQARPHRALPVSKRQRSRAALDVDRLEALHSRNPLGTYVLVISAEASRKEAKTNQRYIEKDEVGRFPDVLADVHRADEARRNANAAPPGAGPVASAELIRESSQR